MSYGQVIEEIPWEEYEQAIKLEAHDFAALGEIIAKDIIANIYAQITAKGEPLSINEERTLRWKLARGKSFMSLIDSGHLSTLTTWQVTANGDEWVLHLEPAYRDVHLNLIEISDRTGKNYKDFFEVSKKARELVIEEVKHIIGEKLSHLAGAHAHG